MSARRRIVILLCLAAGTGLFFVVLFLVTEESSHRGYLKDLPIRSGFAIREYQHRVEFDSKAWREFRRGANTNEWPHTKLLPIRLRMVDDLLKSYKLSGMTHAEVDSLLGPRTQTEYFNEWDLVFYLGPGRYGDAVGDSEWLVIRFDPEGRVKEYKVVHD